jgi:hypothetical protein
LKNNYNLNITEKDNTINKLQEERKKVEDILKVVNEEKKKIKEETDKNFLDRIKYKRENEEYQNKLNTMLDEKQKELE